VKSFAIGIVLVLGVFFWLSERSTSVTKISEDRATAAGSSSTAWKTDYQKAQEEAKTSHKLVLLNFTGSDWCGWCTQLDRAILNQQQFKDYASKNLVLVVIDFPRQNGPVWKGQSVELKKQNMELAEKFKVDGFPTLVVLSPEGKTVWRYDGYYSGGLAAFLAELDKVRKG
jgi:thioredoxin-related protein